MRIDNVSFPYPVLGISDDIKPTLEESGCDIPEIIVNEEGDEFVIEVTLKLENKDILNYIAKEDAEFSIEVSCKTTKYRMCIPSPVSNFTFRVRKDLFNGKLEFDCFVIARRDIPNYQNEGLNSDYNGHTINLRKGDLLAAYRKCTIPINLDLRNIRNIRSFIQVQRNKRPDAHTVRYELNNSKILILLPDEMMDIYNKKPKKGTEKETERKVILKSSLFLEALTYALLKFDEYKEREELMWVNALTYRMLEPDIKDKCESILNRNDQSSEEQNTEDLFKLAHLMLNQPYINMLQYVSAKEDVGQIFTEE